MRAICFSDALDRGLSQELSVFPVSPLVKEMIRYSERWNEIAGENEEENAFANVLLNLLPQEFTKSLAICLPSTRHEKLSGLLDDFQRRLHEKQSIYFFAQKFGYSLRTLNRLFNSQLGLSFSSYAKLARIIKALELIENGQDQVSDIALAVGYESLPTFSNNFLEICGNRPMHFIGQKKQYG